MPLVVQVPPHRPPRPPSVNIREATVSRRTEPPRLRRAEEALRRAAHQSAPRGWLVVCFSGQTGAPAANASQDSRMRLMQMPSIEPVSSTHASVESLMHASHAYHPPALNRAPVCPVPIPPPTHTHTVAVPICAVLHPRIHTRPAFDTAARSPRLAADTRTPGVLAWSSGRL